MKKIIALFTFCLFLALGSNAQTDTIYTVYKSKFIGEIVNLSNDTLSFIALEDFQKYTKHEFIEPKKIATSVIYKVVFTNLTTHKQNIADSLAMNKNIGVVIDKDGNQISTNTPNSVVLRDPTKVQTQTASYYLIRGSNRQMGSILVGLIGGVVGGIATGISAGKGKFPVVGTIVLGGAGITAFIMNICGISDYNKAGYLLNDGKIGNYNTPTR